MTCSYKLFIKHIHNAVFFQNGKTHSNSNISYTWHLGGHFRLSISRKWYEKEEISWWTTESYQFNKFKEKRNRIKIAWNIKNTQCCFLSKREKHTQIPIFHILGRRLNFVFIKVCCDCCNWIYWGERNVEYVWTCHIFFLLNVNEKI
jgi:hypothetical protein